MIDTPLFTTQSQYVASVAVPAMQPPPELILWGSRYFMRGADGRYRECMCWVAIPIEGYKADPSQI